MGRLLVIDDDPLIIDAVRLALAEENHTVGAALSAAEALAAIEQADWDLAFVDVVLPDMDGLQLLPGGSPPVTPGPTPSSRSRTT
jgi:CheY-like chemotaxis protein